MYEFDTSEKNTNSADASAGVAVTDAPDSGKRLVITDVIFSAGADLEVTLKEETSGTVLLGPLYMATNTTIQITPRSKEKLDTADKKVEVHTNTAGNITVKIYTHSE